MPYFHLLAHTQNLTLTVALITLILSRTVDQTLYYRINFSYRYYVW